MQFINFKHNLIIPHPTLIFFPIRNQGFSLFPIVTLISCFKYALYIIFNEIFTTGALNLMISVSVWCFKSFYWKQYPEHVETQPRGLATRDLWQEKKSKKKKIKAM